MVVGREEPSTEDLVENSEERRDEHNIHSLDASSLTVGV